MVLESEVTWRNRSEGETIKIVYKFSRDSPSRTFGLLPVKLLAQGENWQVIEQERSPGKGLRFLEKTILNISYFIYRFPRNNNRVVVV